MPGRKFLGFSSDNAKNKTFNSPLQPSRKLTDKLKLRAAFYKLLISVRNYRCSSSSVDNNNPNQYHAGTLTKSDREDLNKSVPI